MPLLRKKITRADVKAKPKQTEGETMSILDLDNAIAPIVIVKARKSCHTLDGAMGYFMERVDEFIETGLWDWIHYDKKQDMWYVRVQLFTMPLYWKMDEMTDSNGVPESIDILNPDGSVRKTTTRYIGFDKYKVADEDAGKDLLKQLRSEAGQRDETFVSIMARASEAIKDVDEIELPHINQKAKDLYQASDWAKSLGNWDDKDDTGKNGQGVYSKEKTNKMNQYKQTARRQLGYERAKIVIKVS